MGRETIFQNEHLSKIWDFEKNKKIGLSPNIVTCGSKIKAFWTCEKGHSYSMSVVRKMRNPNSCPICSGHRTVKGVNDFQTLFPDIAKEWHPTRNGGLKPCDFSKQNAIKVWWKCKFGHEWIASIHDRVGSKTGCPECNKRYQTSFAEQAILFYVKKLYPDAVNKYRDVFNNGMELDIYIPSVKCGIEFDGLNWHKTEEEHKREIKKYRTCKENGIILLRIKEKCNDEWNDEWNDVSDYTWFVEIKNKKSLEKIIYALLYSIDTRKNMFFRRTFESYLSNIRVDLKQDAYKIKNYLSHIPNSLVELRPDLIDDWNYDKNAPLVPAMFGINSNDRVFWKCSRCGHEWETAIIQRAGKRNSGCPICSLEKRGKSFTKKCVEKRGSLADNKPYLLKQWHPTKNGNLTPFDITAKCPTLIWWQCEICGHEWRSSPNNRSKGIGCPACAGRVPIVGVNDLKTINPKLASEWNYKKNDGKKPENFLPNSGKKAWWICANCGNEWQQIIRIRNQGSACPKCKRKYADY